MRVQYKVFTLRCSKTVNTFGQSLIKCEKQIRNWLDSSNLKHICEYVINAIVFQHNLMSIIVLNIVNKGLEVHLQSITVVNLNENNSNEKL